MTKDSRLEQSETRSDLRVAALAKKPVQKPHAGERWGLWFSTGRSIDGLWVGTSESKPRPGLRRVEDALRLIKDHDPLQYSRVVKNLDRVWVHLVPTYVASYEDRLKACVLDERFVLSEATTLEHIASAIVHEATHARLERWGISYEEKARPRIEAVCLRRELNFLAKLPHGEPVREGIARTLEWCAGDHEYFSDVSFQQRREQGEVETLRYLGAPDWVYRFALTARTVVSGVHRLVQRVAGPRRA
jgi:hypothetical protein